MNVKNARIAQEQSKELLHTLLNSGLLNNFQMEMELRGILYWKLDLIINVLKFNFHEWIQW